MWHGGATLNALLSFAPKPGTSYTDEIRNGPDLKTAKALDLTVPAGRLAAVDEVIE
jgi:hypothetical protein